MTETDPGQSGATDVIFRFTGLNAQEEETRVPLDFLCAQLQTLQHSIFLFAMTVEGSEIPPDRLRIPPTIKDRYQIDCEAPRSGSYLVPGQYTRETTLFPDLQQQNKKAVAQLMENVVEAIEKEDAPGLAAHIPDGRIRRAILQDFKSVAERAATAEFLTEFRVKESSRSFVYDGNFKAKVEAVTSSESDDAQETGFAIGRLDEIDFGKRKFQIYIEQSRKRLKIGPKEMTWEFDPGFLAENAESLVQLSGDIQFDRDGVPTSVGSIAFVKPVDLSPIVVREIATDSGPVALRDTLRLEPRLDESQQLFLIDHEPLGMMIAADTREDLEVIVQDDLSMLYSDYVLADDDKLAGFGLRIKERLRAMLKVTP